MLVTEKSYTYDYAGNRTSKATYKSNGEFEYVKYLKLCKKSHFKKKWMSDRRDRRITIVPEYHLIVTEGTKNEPQYFEGFKNDINSLYRGRISIVIEGIG